jgi:hypothetical protein
LTRSKCVRVSSGIFAIWVLLSGREVALGANEQFDTRLTAVAFDGAMRANVQGDGHTSAALDGNRLSVTGSYTDLPSGATTAHVFMGAAIGVPGTSIFDLTVSGGTEGSISGDFSLNSKQLAALRSGHLYVQIDSQKAPDGNLWGWLMPAHPVAPPDEPLPGHGFLPQLDVPGNWTVIH